MNGKIEKSRPLLHFDQVVVFNWEIMAFLLANCSFYCYNKITWNCWLSRTRKRLRKWINGVEIFIIELIGQAKLFVKLLYMTHSVVSLRKFPVELRSGCILRSWEFWDSHPSWECENTMKNIARKERSATNTALLWYSVFISKRGE